MQVEGLMPQLTVWPLDSSHSACINGSIIYLALALDIQKHNPQQACQWATGDILAVWLFAGESSGLVVIIFLCQATTLRCQLLNSDPAAAAVPAGLIWPYIQLSVVKVMHITQSQS